MATLKPIIKSSVTDCGMVRIEFDYRTLYDRCYGNSDQAKGKVLDTLDAILARAERAVISEGEGFPAKECIDHYCLSMVDKQDERKAAEKARTGDSKERPGLYVEAPGLYVEAKEVWNDDDQ